MQRSIIPRYLGLAKCQPRTCGSRCFSISASRRANTLMETSGFSETQLQVREAIAKICSNFPDVGSNVTPANMFIISDIHFQIYVTYVLAIHLSILLSIVVRNTGQHTTNQENILTSFMLPLLKMGGLELHFQKSLVDQDWGFQKPQWCCTQSRRVEPGLQELSLYTQVRFTELLLTCDWQSPRRIRNSTCC